MWKKRLWLWNLSGRRAKTEHDQIILFTSKHLSPRGWLWCVCCMPVWLLNSACTPEGLGRDERWEGRAEETLRWAIPPRSVPACSVTSALWHVAVLNRRAIIWCQVVHRPQTSVMALPCCTPVSESRSSIQLFTNTLPCFHNFSRQLPLHENHLHALCLLSVGARNWTSMLFGDWLEMCKWCWVFTAVKCWEPVIWSWLHITSLNSAWFTSKLCQAVLCSHRSLKIWHLVLNLKWVSLKRNLQEANCAARCSSTVDTVTGEKKLVTFLHFPAFIFSWKLQVEPLCFKCNQWEHFCLYLERV